MPDQNWVSQNWRVWLETQTLEQLETSLHEREQALGADKINPQLDADARDHLVREVTMISDELQRRMEAERVKAEFFPRITVRAMKDAQLLGQLLHAHAQEVIGMSQQVMQYKRLADSGFPLAVQFVDPMTGATSSDIDQILTDLGNRAIFTAELLACVSEEMLRLKDTEGVELNETESMAFDEIVRLVEQMGKEEK